MLCFSPNVNTLPPEKESDEEEEETDETLAKARAWDDWKDGKPFCDFNQRCENIWSCTNYLFGFHVILAGHMNL